MTLKERIRNLLLNEAAGGLTGFDPKTEDTPALQRHNDVKRKRVDRQGDNREKRLERNKKEQQAVKKGVEPPHPRTYLQSELRLSLKEAFAVCLVEYLNTDKHKYILDAIKLMEEYPALKKYVQETSQAALPQQTFSVYAAREHLDEEVGSPGYRSGDTPHNWSLTHHQAIDKAHHIDRHMVLEAKITPDKALIYIPAFSKLMENLIYSGKIDEPQENILRKVKSHNEVILPPSIDKGLVIHVKK